MRRWAKVVGVALLTLSAFNNFGETRHLAEQRAEQARIERAREAERAAGSQRSVQRDAEKQVEREAVKSEREAVRTEQRAAESQEKLRRDAERQVEREKARTELDAKRGQERAAESQRKLQRDAEKQVDRERLKAERQAQRDRERELKQHVRITTADDKVGRSAETSTVQPDTEEKPVGIFGKNITPPAQPSFKIDRALRLRPLAVKSIDVGGTLLFSDSPEYVREPGILYSDVVKGDARVLYYHVNETGVAAKVAVVLENAGDQRAVVHVTRSASAPPSADYLKVGRETQAEYFADRHEPSALYVAAGERQLLTPEMNKTLVGKGELAYGIVDFTTSQPLRASVVLCPFNADPLSFVRTARVLPKDEQRLRGTFSAMDRLIVGVKAYQPRRDGAVYVNIGTGDDAFKMGIDATDGSLVCNEGNYGVLYRFGLTVRGGDATLGVNPMGGVYTGAMRVAKARGEAEQGSGSRHMVPEGAQFFGHETTKVASPDEDGNVELPPGTELATIGTYNPSTLVMEFSPPGASNLPVRLVISPSNKKAGRR